MTIDAMNMTVYLTSFCFRQTSTGILIDKAEFAIKGLHVHEGGAAALPQSGTVCFNAFS